MRLLGKLSGESAGGSRWRGGPAAIRIAPFAIFLALTICQGKPDTNSAYWFYLAKTLVGAWLVWETWPLVSEMRWAFSGWAIVVGVGAFAIWVGLDPYYPHLMKNGGGWNPFAQFGQNSVLAWVMIGTRIVGSTLVVPPIEEVFYRSFVYRYIAKKDFLSVPLNKFLPIPFLVTVAAFGFAHNEWLAGILCGAAYQWLVIRKGRLGEAMTAHAITNFLLGVWVVWQNAWHFW